MRIREKAGMVALAVGLAAAPAMAGGLGCMLDRVGFRKVGHSANTAAATAARR